MKQECSPNQLDSMVSRVKCERVLCDMLAVHASIINAESYVLSIT